MMPYSAYLQPYSTWVALIFLTMVVTCYGYTGLLPGRFAIDTFFTYYMMVLVAPVLLFGWKLLKRTKFVPPHETDLLWQRPTIDAYEAAYDEPVMGFWTEIGQMFGFRRNKKLAEI
jgi:amino acid transporter